MKEEFAKFVEEFIEEVISEMDFTDMDDEQGDELRELIASRVDKMIMGVMLENLSDEEFQELTKKLEEQDWNEEEQQAIFSEAAIDIPDFEDKLAEAFHELKIELVEDAEDLKRISEE